MNTWLMLPIWGQLMPAILSNRDTVNLIPLYESSNQVYYGPIDSKAIIRALILLVLSTMSLSIAIEQ